MGHGVVRMTINRLLDITIAVPDPDALTGFWARRGLDCVDGGLGTNERPRQLTFVDGAYRHLAELHLGCESEADLAAVASRLDALGIAVEISDTSLACDDPVFDHRVVVDVVGPAPLSGGPERMVNRPGRATRITARADVIDEPSPRAPRRVGHVVLATPHVAEACVFYLDGLGFRISDRMLDGVLTFARVEPDHHNLLIQPAPVSYLNHYAVEMDDLDAVGAAGTAVLAEQPDAHVVGVGRHRLGSNLFWYLFDPAGNMFEFFADMDQIADDQVWERDHRRDDWTPDEAGLSVWGPADPPDIFFNPPDLAAIGAAAKPRGSADHGSRDPRANRDRHGVEPRTGIRVRRVTGAAKGCRSPSTDVIRTRFTKPRPACTSDTGSTCKASPATWRGTRPGPIWSRRVPRPTFS